MGNILDCSSGEKENVDDNVTQEPQMETTTGPLVIEEKKHPLQSYIWNLQRSYFESLAKESHSRKSSSISLSSNCYIAKCYASIIMSYVLDWYSDASHDKSDPVYIFDIGAGLGKLGYLIVFRLFEMKELWPESSHPPFVYVLTEMTMSYIAQWERNPLISQFVQLGYIDYGIFDIEKDHSITLIRSGKSISPLSLKTPPFIICSNVLSYLPQDVLMVEDHQIKQSYLTLLQYTNQIFQHPFQSYDFAWSYEETNQSFSDNYTSILPFIQQHDGKYIIPTTALTMISTLLAWCNLQGVFLICDRGFYSQEDQYLVKDPAIATVPIFSLPLNFYLVEEYCRQNGGDFRISSFQEEFRCGLFSFNIPKSSLSRTYYSYHTQCQDFTVQSYYTLQKSIQEESLLSFRSIVYLLRLSQHDPSLYYQFKQTITSSYSVLNGSSFDNDLLFDCDHIRDHISSYQKGFDISFELGRLYMGLGDYRTALELFEDSIKYVEPHPVTWYNMGLCSYYINNLENAKQCFVCALSLNPNYEAAKEKLNLLTGGTDESEEINENTLSRDNVDM